jgi:hypothetical protein
MQQVIDEALVKEGLIDLEPRIDDDGGFKRSYIAAYIPVRGCTAETGCSGACSCALICGLTAVRSLLSPTSLLGACRSSLRGQ